MLLAHVRRGVVAAAGMVVAVGCGNVVVVDSTSGTTTDTGGGGAGTTTSTTITTGTGGGGAGGTTGTGGTGGSIEAECATNADCKDHPNGPLCNVETGKCVACIPTDPPELDCGIGQWCDPPSGQCKAGCTGKADCVDPGGMVEMECDLDNHVCVGCLNDDACAAGTVCIGGACVPGCNQDHVCQPGLSCCQDQCFDLDKDVNNCGACFNVCLQQPNSVPVCTNGLCISPDCTPGFADCDSKVENGCEHNVLSDGPCVCQPGSTESCYLGAPGTEGVGVCHAGQRSCNAAGTKWGSCNGQVLPAVEICANGADDDCDGAVDEPTDADNDGWTDCEGDCNDADPKVNPGALEITYQSIDDDGLPWTPPVIVEGVGNGLDDDCNPATPDVGSPSPCSAGALNTGVTALDLARALELCQDAVAGAPKPQRTWGLVSAQLLRADGTPPSAAQIADLQNAQAAVLTGYGAYLPKKGVTMVGLSTGKMRAPGDAGYVAPSPGTNFGWAGSPPAQYLAAHLGSLPGSSGCNGACPGGSDANDGAALRVAIRTPTNMNALSFALAFLSAEYPANVCTAKNDFFLALYGSNTPGIPQDRNVAFDGLANPLSVNNAFFDVCAPSGCATCPQGSAGLAGTGMPAGTSWLQQDLPFVPGETVTLDLTVFDVSDGAGDSVALIDAFRFWYNQPCLACP